MKLATLYRQDLLAQRQWVESQIEFNEYLRYETGNEKCRLSRRLDEIDEALERLDRQESNPVNFGVSCRLDGFSLEYDDAEPEFEEEPLPF